MIKLWEKDEIITDQTVVGNDITSSYELNQRPNRLAVDRNTLIRRRSEQAWIVWLIILFMD